MKRKPGVELKVLSSLSYLYWLASCLASRLCEVLPGFFGCFSLTSILSRCSGSSLYARESLPKTVMEQLKGKINGVKVFFRTDWNFVRAKRLVKRGFRTAPRGAARYLNNRVPFVGWIAIYNFRWLPFDVLSGITVGLVLALQAVNLALPIPGGISVQQTLLASWLPGFIYAITGTSKSEIPSTSSSCVAIAISPSCMCWRLTFRERV